MEHLLRVWWNWQLIKWHSCKWRCEKSHVFKKNCYCYFSSLSDFWSTFRPTIFMLHSATGSPELSPWSSRPWPRSWRQIRPSMCFVSEYARVCSSIRPSRPSPTCPHRTTASSSPTRYQCYKTWSGAGKLMGENLKLVWAEFLTLSYSVSMMCMYLSTWIHAHIYCWKFGPSLVLLAEICPWLGHYCHFGNVG